MTDFLTLPEVLAMHEDQIERYGGSPGVRDYGLLESASIARKPAIMPISSKKRPRSGRA